MDTKTRVKNLMDGRGWSIYELAKRSGMSQTTISNMWKRNTEPTLPTLRAFCAAFGITLEEFFSDDNRKMEKEYEPLMYYLRLLDDRQKEALLVVLEAMTKK